MFYVSKIFLLIVFLAVIIGSAVAVKFVYPAIVAKFFTRDIYLQTGDMTGYTGKVRLLSKGGTVIFTFCIIGKFVYADVFPCSIR